MYVLHLSRLMVYKKAGLHCCCSASLGSGIAFNSEQATPKPTPICTYTRALLARAIIKDTYPEDIKMLLCVGAIEFSRFREAKHKARWTPHKTSFIGDPVLTPYYVCNHPTQKT